MSKELEELKIVRESIVDMYNQDMSMDGIIALSLDNRLDIIEYALKILEQLQVIIGAEKIEDLPKLALETENACYNACYELKETEKKLKALEIIKNKNVFVWGFVYRPLEIKDFEWTYEYYKTHYGYFHSGYHVEPLTQEEYDLLKEVLL